ncbi:MAG: acetylornithine/succinyldiaminopimelate transaminase [Succinivibrio sp.]|nr:acetylornithine/succinyldiaminopimelate transaminase [Succinivibrio sp.]
MSISRKTFDEVMFQCYKPLDMMIQRAHGAFVYDSSGNRYLDLTAGIAVNSLGHTPKGVQKVIRKQADELIHCSNIFTNKKTLELGKKLVSMTDFDRVFFVNSGAEANECALKLARRVAFNEANDEKNEIISFLNSFHGRTLFSVCVGGQDKYSDGFGPKPAAITHLPYNDVETFTRTISEKTCAVILEPVQGEGGIIPVDPKFLKTVRELCSKYKAMLIFDEVQTGVGRTGALYEYQNLGVIPDAITTAKGLGAGLPIGAVLAKEEFARHFGPGTHGSTFGGNPLACAVGCYVIEKIGDPVFLNKVREKGQYLKEGLESIGRKYGVFEEVRGKGLLLGCVLTDRYQGRSGSLQQYGFKHKLLTLVAGSNVLRIAPPLNIKKSLLDKGLKMLEKAVTDFTADQSVK